MEKEKAASVHRGNLILPVFLMMVIGLSSALMMATEDRQWKEQSDFALKLYGQKRFSEALSAGLLSLSLAEKVFGREHPNYILSLNNIGEIYRALGDISNSEKYFMQAVDGEASRAGGNATREMMRFSANLAMLYESEGRYEESEKYFRTSLSSAYRVFGGASREYVLSLARIGQLQRKAGKFHDADRQLENAAGIIRREGLDETEEHLMVLSNLGLNYQESGDFAKAEEFLKKAVLISGKLHGENSEETAACINRLSVLHYKLSNYREARELTEKFIEIGRKSGKTATSEYSTGISNLAAVYYAQKIYPNAEKIFLSLLQEQERELGRDHPSTVDSLRNLGVLYYSWRKHVKAREFLERALQVAGGKPMGNGLQHDEGISTLGLTYEALGFPEKALSLYAGALKVKEKASGLQQYRMLPALNDYGTLCFRWGCDMFTLPLELPRVGFLPRMLPVLVPLALLEESGRIFERGSDIALQFPVQAYPDSMTTANYFTEFLAIAGSYDEAESHYLNIAGSYKRTFGADHLNTANILSQFADFYGRTGKTGKALPLMKEVIRIYQVNGLGNDVKITGSLRALGRIYLAGGEYAKGLSEFKKRLSILENTYGTEAIQIANDVYEIADIYRRMGMNPEAGTWYLRALKIWDANTPEDHMDSVAFLRDISEKLRLTGNKQWRKLNTRIRAVLRKEAQKKLLNN